MLSYDLSKRGKTPAYKYVYQCIKNDILNGHILPGDKLPSKRIMAKNLGVAVITIENAYGLLQDEAYIQSMEKRGYFVSDLPGMQIHTEAPNIEEEIDEYEYYFDFKANRIGTKHFPISIWNKYLKEAYHNNAELLKTVPYNGLYRLRKAIADNLLDYRGMKVSPSQIIVGAGSEYIYGRLMQLIAPYRLVAFEDPGYKRFAMIAETYKAQVRYVPIDDKGLNVRQLRTSNSDIVHVSPSNHFPTGIIMPLDRRIELLEWAAEKPERYIIEDDYDSEFRYDNKLILPLYTRGTNEDVIYINTFSKTLVPSIRISYMILPELLIDRYKETVNFYACTVSSFEQYALARFMEDGAYGRHISRMRNFYRSQRNALMAALDSSRLMKIAQIQENNSGTHFVLKVKTKLTKDEIFKSGLNHDFVLSFISDYCIKPGRSDECKLVINYAAIEPEMVGEIVKRLEDIFPETKRKIL